MWSGAVVCFMCSAVPAVHRNATRPHVLTLLPIKQGRFRTVNPIPTDWLHPEPEFNCLPTPVGAVLQQAVQVGPSDWSQVKLPHWALALHFCWLKKHRWAVVKVECVVGPQLMADGSSDQLAGHSGLVERS
jgi:hypothetical protein